MINNYDDNKDMLNGSLALKIVMFAMPIAITSSLQQLFNAADIIVCGKFVGSIALAAVGANSQIINLFINSFLGLSVGANVMIANYIGAEKKQKIYNVVHTSMTFAVVFGIVLLIIGLFFSENILLLLDTPDEILNEATLYLRIIFIGIPFVVVYNFGAAILRSIGDTKRPLIILTITGVLNVILNLIFVIKFNMGVAGVATATAISNAISSIVVVILLASEKSSIHYDITKWMIVPDSLLKIMRIGVPSAISGMVFSTSNLCVQSAINSLGTKTIAANTAALNVESFTFYITTAFSSACLTFMSQNYGAEKYDRCKIVVRDCILLGMSFCGLLVVFLEIFAMPFLSIFTNDMEVISIAMTRLRIVTALAFIQPIYEVHGSAIRVLKHPYIQTIAVIFGIIVFRLIWVFFVFPIFGTYKAICFAYPISWSILIVFMAIAYMRISKKMLKPNIPIYLNVIK